MRVEPERRVANEVLHENGIFVGAFRDGLFVLAFQVTAACTVSTKSISLPQAVASKRAV